MSNNMPLRNPSSTLSMTTFARLQSAPTGAERIYLPGGPLIGFRLIGRSYVRIPPGIGGGIPARTLGVELKLRGDSMGFYDAVLGEWLKTPAEKAAAALQEEAAARQVAEAAFRVSVNRIANDEIRLMNYVPLRNPKWTLSISTF